MSALKSLSIPLTLGLLVAVSIALLYGCGGGASNGSFPAVPEVIVFASLASTSLDSSVMAISPDGSLVMTILQGDNSKAYEWINGNSSKSILLVTVTDITHTPTTSTLQSFQAQTGQFQVLLPVGEGEGTLAPNNQQYVTAKAPANQPALGRIWLHSVNSDNPVQLTGSPSDPFEDCCASWHPNGSTIAFIRIRFDQPPFATSSLFTISVTGGPEQTILPGDNPINPAYSPDGNKIAFISDNGLEILDLATSTRTIVVTHASFPGQYQSEGLVWLRTQPTLVFPVFNKSTSHHEFWSVSTNGQNLKLIYTDPRTNGFISGVSAVMNN